MKEANREVLDRGSLPQMLAHRARQASDRRLALDAALGLIAAAGFAVLRPPLWIPLTALAICLGAFGVWGILDRELVDSAGAENRVRVFAWARSGVALTGGAAAIVFGVTLFFALLGPIIS
jgi:hypothetical protein